ncbi:MAG: SHOCT domain-containing protein [Methanoregula sp.]|jgi:putative membrane protein|nr:SHOCT domain-containing protein [Methanoregula sp.]
MPLGLMYSTHSMHPFFGMAFMIIAWIVQLVIAYFVYKDAKEQKMSAPLWFILVIIPMYGFLLAILYVIIREVRMPIETQKTPVDILKARFAKGEITVEEYEKGKDVLMK